MKAVLFGTDRRPGQGLSAGLWATWAIAAVVAAIAGVINGIWWAALFFIPGAFMFATAVRRAGERNI